jgi:hypothetical protein
MILHPDDQLCNPNFTRYIRDDFPKLKGNPHIRAALKKWGKLTDIEVNNVLSWGFPPRIDIVGIGADNFPTSINISAGLVMDFNETAKATPLPPTTKSHAVLKNARGRLVYSAGIAILGLLIEGNLRLIEKKSSHPKKKTILI